MQIITHKTIIEGRQAGTLQPTLGETPEAWGKVTCLNTKQNNVCLTVCPSFQMKLETLFNKKEHILFKNYKFIIHEQCDPFVNFFRLKGTPHILKRLRIVDIMLEGYLNTYHTNLHIQLNLFFTFCWNFFYFFEVVIQMACCKKRIKVYFFIWPQFYHLPNSPKSALDQFKVSCKFTRS